MRKELISAISLVTLTIALVLNATPVMSQEAWDPLVYVDPPSITGLNPCQNFTITVRIANVTDLYGFDLRLRWNPAILDYVSHTAKVPVDTYPDGVLYNPMFLLKNDVNATEGTYWLAGSSLSPAPSFNGTGIFFEMTFHVNAYGRSSLEIYSVDLSDHLGDPIIPDVQHGFFSNVVTTPADIYVSPASVVDADLTPSKNFTVDVNLDGAMSLESLEFWFGYNTSILDVTNVTGNPIFSSVVIDIFEIQGELRVAANASPSITGDLTLATITLHVADTGETLLDLFNITLTDEWSDPHPYNTPGDGYFSNILKAKLFVDPPEIIDPTILPGSQFYINIRIDDVFELYGYSFHLSYDTNVLTCLGALISPPSNDTHFTTEISVDDPLGNIAVNVSYYSPAEPITLLSETTIVTIHFQAQDFGCTPLDLYDTTLTNSVGGSIPHDVEDGFFCTLIADIAVTGIEASPNMVYPGRSVTIAVTVENLGDTMASDFNVTVYSDNMTIGTETIDFLAPNLNTTVFVIWDTTGLESCNNYTLSAEASPVLYELDLTNNYLVEGWVKIKIIGDVNGDGVVDIFDLVAAGEAYGSSEGDPDYNADADVAPMFGVVDIFDMVTIASHYGESC
ncbi:MAG: hypothetical protein JSV64_06140 [Candidatus Bathyarchaeota archaeon]|nr:MAG: hypothetical protein JSV64_06140 [Candidatus Bathyarchaeota archaeon]